MEIVTKRAEKIADRLSDLISHTEELTSEAISDSAECYSGLSVRFELSAACM